MWENEKLFNKWRVIGHGLFFESYNFKCLIKMIGRA